MIWKMNNRATTTSGTPSNHRINPGIMMLLLMANAHVMMVNKPLYCAISLPSTGGAHADSTRAPALGKHGGSLYNGEITLMQGYLIVRLILNLRE